MSPVLLVGLLLIGTLTAHPHMYTVPCPITQTLSQPYAPTDPQSQSQSPYPMKIIVSYPQNQGGQPSPSCNAAAPNPDSVSRRGDLGTVTSILKLPAALADKLISGEISLK